MTNIRLISRLDIKGENLIKGIQLEGLRKVGDPNLFALKYYQEGADELLYIDSVASLYQRNSLSEIIERTTECIFIPITVGGGLRTLDDVKQVLRSGADKVAINTAAIKKPNLISEIANKFGSQCCVVSIQAKKIGKNKWVAYTDNGREKTAVDVVDWALKAESLGAGEILVTSIDKEGTYNGFDCELIKVLTNETSVPLIASGGFGKQDDLNKVVKAGANAVSIAGALHFNKTNLEAIRSRANYDGLRVRQI